MKLSIGAKIALAIVVASGGVVAWAGVHAYRFLQTERGQEFVRSARVSQDGKDGAGALELRRLGCEAPVITDFKRMVETAPTRYPAATLEAVNNTDAGKAPVVMCQDLIGPLVSCEHLAATYAAAISPDQRFLVFVVRGIEAKCSAVASRSGDLVGPINADTLASLGEADVPAAERGD
jgi:hypothetical protein